MDAPNGGRQRAKAHDNVSMFEQGNGLIARRKQDGIVVFPCVNSLQAAAKRVPGASRRRIRTDCAASMSGARLCGP